MELRFQGKLLLFIDQWLMGVGSNLKKKEKKAPLSIRNSLPLLNNIGMNTNTIFL